MAVEATLVGKKREERGTAACRRLRQQGLIPANVYGHKEAAAAISVSTDGLNAVLASGHKVIELSVDGKTETAMIRELQWDAFSIRVQHIDLLRIDRNEKVVLDVPLELRGQAPGTLTGGHLEQPVRAVSIECQVINIPDKIFVRIGHLGIGGTVYARELELPEGVRLLTSPDVMIVHVVQAKAMLPAEGAAPVAVAEPELIRKPAEAKEEE